MSRLEHKMYNYNEEFDILSNADTTSMQDRNLPLSQKFSSNYVADPAAPTETTAADLLPHRT